MAISPAREDSQGVKFEAELICVDGRVAAARQRALMRLSRKTIFDAPLPGQRFTAQATLALPRPPRNPGEFDERAFLADQGLQWEARGASVAAFSPPEGRWRISALAERSRRAVERAYRERLSPVDAHLLAGLSLGFKGALPRKLSRDVEDAGVMHLLVPSGAKAVLVLAVLALAGQALAAPPWARVGLEAAGGGFYVLLAGGQAPYARAYLAWLALRLGQIADRDAGAFHALVVSAWLQLLWQPSALFSLGFQMTYAAALALLAALPALRRGVPRAWPRWARRAALALLATAVVEAVLWPFLAQAFGRAAVSGALANVVLVPAAGPLMVCGFLLAAAQRLRLESTAALLARVCGAGLRFFSGTCHALAGLPWAVATPEPLSAWGWAAYGCGLLAVFSWPKRKVRWALLGVAASLWFGSNFWQRKQAPALEVVYLSLPRRHCALLRRHGGAAILIVDGAVVAPEQNAARALGWGPPAERVFLKRRPGYLACEKSVCFSFAPPGIREAQNQFSIMAVLRRGAARLSTDGDRVQIEEAGDQFGRGLL